MTKKQHISRDEERKLSRAAQRGNTKAQQRLVEEHYPFVVWLATRYSNCGVSSEELIQAGVLGLLEAIKRDNLGPVKLLTFGFWTIRRHMIDAIRDSTCFTNDGAYNRFVRYSLDSGVPEEMRHPVSLEQTIAGEDTGEVQTLGSTIADETAVDPSDAADDNEGLRLAKYALRRMEKRTQQIVQMRLGHKKQAGMSFVAIGKHFCISAERARRIFIGTMKKLKKRIEGE